MDGGIMRKWIMSIGFCALLLGWAVLLAVHASAANASTARMKGQPWYGYTPIPAAMQPTRAAEGSGDGGSCGIMHREVGIRAEEGALGGISGS